MAVTVHIEGKTTTHQEIKVSKGTRVDTVVGLVYVYAADGTVLGIFTPANVYGVTVDD